MSETKRSGALDGVRVVDLTTVLMGPLACRMLADHGADVIQVVSPDTPQSVMSDSTGMGGISLDIQRNKRSIRLDLKSEAGRSALWDLIGTADVLVTNMRARALDRLGFSSDAVRERHPEMIYCLANGYGAEGPYADRAAYDDAIQAISGFAGLTARISGQPAYAPSVVVDKICSLVIVQAVMAALLHRQACGEGQTINVPMFETMAAFTLVEHFRGAALEPPRGEIGYSRLLNPNRRPFQSADGWVAILPYTDKNWRDFFGAIGQPELMDDPRFSTHSARTDHSEIIYGIVADSARLKTTEQWLSFCDAHSIPCNPVLDIADLQTDPHMQAVNFMPLVEHPVEGAYRLVRDPVSYDTMDNGLRRHAPVPGEHTEEILRELNWSDAQIAALEE